MSASNFPMMSRLLINYIILDYNNKVTSSPIPQSLHPRPPPKGAMGIANVPRYATSNGHPTHCCFELIFECFLALSINH